MVPETHSPIEGGTKLYIRLTIQHHRGDKVSRGTKNNRNRGRKVPPALVRATLEILRRDIAARFLRLSLLRESLLDAENGAKMLREP